MGRKEDGGGIGRKAIPWMLERKRVRPPPGSGEQGSTTGPDDRSMPHPLPSLGGGKGMGCVGFSISFLKRKYRFRYANDSI
jgi:hypothetical protein